MGYDKTTDIIEAGILLKLISKAWAFYSIGNQKVQGKEKLAQYLESDEKVLKELQGKIENSIKEMRTWKKVLDDEVFNELDAIAEDITTDDEAGA
jgi:hypothetical protein